VLAHGIGIGRDPVTACAWYTLASISGQKDSSNPLSSLSQTLSAEQIGEVRLLLGQMFWNGIGVQRDVTAAYMWFVLAGATGSPSAAQHEKELAADMSHAQIVAAKRRADDWLLHHHLPPVKR
jgi:TPR repeat protein